MINLRTQGLLLLMNILLINVSSVYASNIKKAEELEAAILKDNKIDEIVRPGSEYTAQDFRDPFKRHIEKVTVIEVPVVGPQDETPVESEVRDGLNTFNINIQGLIWGGRLPQAIINNKVVGEGDTLKLSDGREIQLLKIGREGILFSFGGVHYKLRSPASSNMPNKESEGG